MPKGEAPDSTESNADPDGEQPHPDLDEEWRATLSYYSSVVNDDLPRELFEDWHADYDYENLWTARFPISKRKGGRTTTTFIYASPTQCHNILWNRTYWYKRLSPQVQKKFRKEFLQDRHGKLILKEILHYSDAQVIGMVMGFPELFLRERRIYDLSDRIHHSIISNFTLNFGPNREARLKEFRKELRWCMFRKERYPKQHMPREFSFYSEAVNILNSMSSGNSRQKMFKVMMITQTRASGLASKGLVKDTIERFLETVCTPQDFITNENLEAAIELVTDRISETHFPGLSPMTKISISTSACVEMGRRGEGKFGFLKKVCEDLQIDEPRRTLQYDGEPGGIAHPIYDVAVFKALAESDEYFAPYYDENLMSVNVAAIRENGKARVVTSGSFWKEALLQPFSHMTIEMCKAEPILTNGFRARKLGWQAVESFDDHPFLLNDEGNLVAYSTDWEKATDNPTHESGRRVMEPLLSKIGVPDRLIEILLNVWVGNKELYLGGHHVGTMVNGIPMGDPLTKTNLSLAHPISEEYARLCCREDGVTLPRGTLCEGNGDDEYAIYSFDDTADCDYFLDKKEEAAAMLGYRTSKFDTFMSRDWFFYCEELCCVPQHRWNTAKWSRKFKNIDLLPYLDYPRIRLIIDTQKDREDFSSRPDGKITLMGKEIRYLPRSSVQFQYYQLASCFQDVCLSTNKIKNPFLIPYQVFGIGKPPIGFSARSFRNALAVLPEWKQKLSNQVARELMTGEFVLLNHRGVVRQGERHFDKESTVEIFEIPWDDPIKAEVVVKKEQLKLFPPGLLQVLTRNGHLVTERNVAKVYLYNQRLKSLSQDLKDVDLFQRVKQQIDGVNVEPLSDDEMDEYLGRWESEAFLFAREIDEDLYGAMQVANLMHSDPIFVAEFPFMDGEPDWYDNFDGTVVNPRVGTSYQNQSEELWHWFVDNYMAILEGEPYEEPPHFVIEDDPVLEHEAGESFAPVLAVVSDDVRMVRRIANKCYQKAVCHITCRDWYKTLISRQYYDVIEDQTFILDEDPSEKLARDLNEKFGKIHLLIDHGNLAGFRGRLPNQDASSFHYKWSDALPYSVDDWINDDGTIKPSGAWMAGAKNIMQVNSVLDFVTRYGGASQVRKYKLMEEVLRLET